MKAVAQYVKPADIPSAVKRIAGINNRNRVKETLPCAGLGPFFMKAIQ